MAKGHSYLWRAPGRRNKERERFGALMRKVEARRLRLGMTKAELAAELGTTDDAVRAWMTGGTVGRKETVAKIQTFLEE
jgi:transcriptional regulator with XRE-family HTH domain